MNNKITFTTDNHSIIQNYYSENYLNIGLSVDHKYQLTYIIEKAKKKHNNYITITIELPRRPRTTGEKSQNNYYWKLISYLVEYTGHDSKYLHTMIKSLAVGCGYPQKEYQGKKQFLMYTDMPEGIDFRDASVEEAIKLIECAETECINLGINIEKE